MAAFYVRDLGDASDAGATAVRDATWGLGLEDEEVTLGRWASRGNVVTLSELTG